MSNKNKWLIEFGAIAVIATFVAAYFYIEDQKKRKRIIDL